MEKIQCPMVRRLGGTSLVKKTAVQKGTIAVGKKGLSGEDKENE